MNPSNDPLEAELAALQPRDVSPVLGGRIRQSLGDPTRTGWRWPWNAALAGGLAAACVTAAVLGEWLGSDLWRKQDVIACPAALDEPSDDSLPTVRVYQQALARSPEALDTLLDQHGVRDLQPEPRGAEVYAFPRSDVEIRSLIGEL